MLTDIGVFEPVLSNLLALPHLTPAYARRWREWFERQDTYGIGWVINQMRSGLQPPSEKPTSLPPPEYLARPAMSPLEKQWAQIVNFMSGAMTADMHRNTFATAQALTLVKASRSTPATLVITAPTPAARAWLGQRFKQRIQDTWEQLFGESVSLTVEEPVNDAQDFDH